MLLKKLNPTRWSSRVQSILAVKLRFADIIKALVEINLKSTKKEEREEAIRIKNKMMKFDFVFICEFLFRVMNEINYGSKILQKRDITLDEATLVLNRVYENISKLRDSYEEIKSEAKKWQGIGE